MPDKEIIRRLQNAHAAHIKTIYADLAGIDCNPYGIEVSTIGDTRVFLSNQDRLENRAIFTGNETREVFEAVARMFDAKGVNGYFEINPANFYRNDPFSWSSEVMPILLELGFRPEGFRCVWYTDDLQLDESRSDSLPEIATYLPDDAAAFATERLNVQPPKIAPDEKQRDLIQGFSERWRHYIGYEDGAPVSTSSLFLVDNIGYLSWGYTQRAHRRKRHHRAHCLKRMNDAAAAGCPLAFSVTDFDAPSAFSLRACGFRLAYNYILMLRPGNG